jgi:hypothetical protein
MAGRQLPPGHDELSRLVGGKAGQGIELRVATVDLELPAEGLAARVIDAAPDLRAESSSTPTSSQAASICR